MSQEQSLEIINRDTLFEKASAMRLRGWRLVQISATRLLDGFELTYSFDLDFKLASLRLHVPENDAKVPSISSVYGCSVLYENEIHDLFGIRMEGLALDFHGNLYKTRVKFPFATVRPPTAKPAPAAKPTPASTATPPSV